MEAAPQTVVDSVRVMVVAGNVYVPGVGQTVTSGVGTGTTGTTVEVGVTGAEVAGAGGKTTAYKCERVFVSISEENNGIGKHTRTLAGDGGIDGGATARSLRSRTSRQKKTPLQMHCLVGMATSTVVTPSINACDRRSDSNNSSLHLAKKAVSVNCKPS